MHVIFHKRTDLLEHISLEHCWTTLKGIISLVASVLLWFVNRKGFLVRILVNDGVGEKDWRSSIGRLKKEFGYEGFGSG
jgi:hypothetical protein